MRVREVMNQYPVCCSRTTSAMNAARMMHEFDVGMLPVVDELSMRRLIGVVTDRDLCLKVLVEEHDPTLTTVEDCMTTDLVTCTPEADVREVIAAMASRQIRRLPVVDRNNNVRGVVAISDLIAHKGVESVDVCWLLNRITSSRAKAQVAA